MLTQWQRLIADRYGDGDYQHLQSLDECRDVGDTLFTFLMIETDPKEDCDGWIEAIRRIDAAQRQLADLMDTFKKHAPYLTARGRQAYEADLAEAAEGDICTACERDSMDCSRDPGAAVVVDREA